MSYYDIDLRNVYIENNPGLQPLPQYSTNEQALYREEYRQPYAGYSDQNGFNLNALSAFRVPLSAVGGLGRIIASFVFYLFKWFFTTFGVYFLWAIIFIYVFWWPIQYVFQIFSAINEYQSNLREALGELSLSTSITGFATNFGLLITAVFPFLGYELQYIQDDSIPDDACQCSWLNKNLQSRRRTVLQWLPEMSRKLCAIEEDDGKIHVGLESYNRRCQYTNPDSGRVVQYPRNNLRGTENRGYFFLSGKSLGEDLPGTCRPSINRYTPETKLRNYQDIGFGRGVCFTYDYVGKATFDLSGSMVLAAPGTLICRDDATGDIINDGFSCKSEGTTLECWDGTAPLGSYFFKKTPEKNDFLYIENNKSMCNVGVPFLP